jgi:hypothetical protein
MSKLHLLQRRERILVRKEENAEMRVGAGGSVGGSIRAASHARSEYICHVYPQRSSLETGSAGFYLLGFLRRVLRPRVMLGLLLRHTHTHTSTHTHTHARTHTHSLTLSLTHTHTRAHTHTHWISACMYAARAAAARRTARQAAPAVPHIDAERYGCLYRVLRGTGANTNTPRILFTASLPT